MLGLCAKSLWNRRFVAGLTVLSIALSVALILGVDRLRSEARASFANAASGIDLIVAARGNEVQILLATVFGVGPTGTGIDWESYELVAEMPQVDWAVPVMMGDNHRGYPVIGTTAEYFARYRHSGGTALAFAEGGVFDDAEGAVVGADVADAFGYAPGTVIVNAHGAGAVSFDVHDEAPFTVTGVLARTGTAVDRMVFVSLEGFDAIHAEQDAAVADPFAMAAAGADMADDRDDHADEPGEAGHAGDGHDDHARDAADEGHGGEAHEDHAHEDSRHGRSGDDHADEPVEAGHAGDGHDDHARDAADEGHGGEAHEDHAHEDSRHGRAEDDHADEPVEAGHTGDGHDDHARDAADEAHGAGAQADHADGHDHGHEPGQINAVFAGLKDRSAVLSVQRRIAEYRGDALTAVLPNLALLQLWSITGTAETALRLMAGAVAVAGLIGMVVMLSASLETRRREFAILRSVGATPANVFALIVMEAALLLFSGVVMGYLVLTAAVLVADPVLAARFGLSIGIGLPTMRELGLVVLVVCAGLLASVVPAVRIYRMTLADGLSIRV